MKTFVKECSLSCVGQIDFLLGAKASKSYCTGHRCQFIFIVQQIGTFFQHLALNC